MNKISKLGVLDEKRKKTFGGVFCVYSTYGICPTLIAGMTHGNTIPFIIENERNNVIEKEKK